MSSIDQTFASIDRHLSGMEQELRGLRSDVSSDISRLRDTLIQVGFGLVGVLLAAMVALVLALA